MLSGPSFAGAVDSEAAGALLSAALSLVGALVSLDDAAALSVAGAWLLLDAAWSLGVEQAETASATTATAAQAQRAECHFLLNVVRTISPLGQVCGEGTTPQRMVSCVGAQCLLASSLSPRVTYRV
jgi:hypothetical protein